MKRKLAIAFTIIIAAGLMVATRAQARDSRSQATCRPGYVAKTTIKREQTIRHHKRVWRRVKVRECVFAPTTPPAPITSPSPTPTLPTITTSTPALTYQASLTSAVTVSASSPLAVTYNYSADAILNGASLGAEDQLPAGFLSIFSTTTGPSGIEEQLCSINVGITGNTANCTFSYAQAGTYAVTVQYAPSDAPTVDVHYTINVQPFGSPATQALDS